MTSGDIVESTSNHPTLGTFTFYPKAGEDNTYELGGYRNADDQNSTDGAGRFMAQKNRVVPYFEIVVACDMNDKKEYDMAVKLAESNELSDWTITHINGTVHGLRGIPVGDIQLNVNNGTFTLKVAGENKMKQIV